MYVPSLSFVTCTKKKETFEVLVANNNEIYVLGSLGLTAFYTMNYLSRKWIKFNLSFM